MDVSMESDISLGNILHSLYKITHESYFSKPGHGEFVKLNQIVIAQKLFNQK